MLDKLLPYINEKYKNNADIYGFKNCYGVSVPILRNIAKELANEKKYDFFAETHESFEEKMIHAYMIGYIKEDINTVLKYFKEFIVQIDNWAINDGLCQNLKIAKKHPQEVMEFLKPYINSSNEWEIRVVAVILLSHFINDTYVDEVLNVIEKLKPNTYMSKMGVAWAIAEVMCRYPDKCLKFLDNTTIDKWVYNKAISKMNDSFRVSKENKELLKTKKRHSDKEKKLF